MARIKRSKNNDKYFDVIPPLPKKNKKKIPSLEKLVQKFEKC